jgi:hypothetical protein
MDMVVEVVVDLKIVAAIKVIILYLLDKVEMVVADMVAEHIHVHHMEHQYDLVQKLEATSRRRMDMLQWVAAVAEDPLIRVQMV